MQAVAKGMVVANRLRAHRGTWCRPEDAVEQGTGREPRSVPTARRNTTAILDRDSPARALLAAISAVVADTDPATVVGTVVDSAVRLVSADGGACALLGADGELAEIVHYGVDTAGVARLGDDATDTAVVALVLGGTGTPSAALRVDDVRCHDQAAAIAVTDPSIQSLVGVPIRLRGQVVAVLYLTRAVGQPPFSDDDVQRIRDLAIPASVAIANARAFDVGRRREQWLETLAGVATALLSGRALGDVLPAIVRQARDVVDADGAAVALPNSDASLVTVAHVEGFGADQLLNIEIPTDHTFIGNALRGRATIEVDELASDPRVTFRHGVVNSVGPAIYVPLGTPRSVHGVLFVYNRVQAPAFDRHAVSMLNAFAAQVAVALELAERRQDTTRLALLEDRERIARDLHDVVIQRLFAIGLTLEGAGRSINDDSAGRRITRAVDDLDQTIKEIRTTIFGLQALAGPEYSSLRARIVGVVDQAVQALGFVPSLRFEGLIDTTVPAWLSDQVVAVLREALSNAARHARAAQVEVKLSVTADDLTLLVEDDGIGLAEGGRRSGLRNMEVRAATHGGRLVLRSGQVAGTHLEWAVPLRMPADAKSSGGDS
jgi:signal transduction histidine kinase